MSALALVFERPWALALAAVALWILVRGWRRPSAQPVATGDLESWREIAPTHAARTPRRVPPPPLALLFAALAVLASAVAIAGPRDEAAAARWLAVLDRSPSMQLDDGAGPRVARAIASAERLASSAGVQLAWIAPPEVTAPRDAPDASWSAPPSRAQPEPAWSAFDVDGALWLSDRAPSAPPARAGWIATGGGAVPGPAALDGADRLDWDGETLVRVPGGAPARHAALGEGVAKDGAFARALEAWSAARGVSAPPSRAGVEVLRLERVATTGAPHTLATGRDGWSASGTARGVVDVDGGLEPWLSAGADVLVASGRGRVVLAWEPEGEIAGDPAAFPVSLAELYDATALSPPAVVPLAERAAAGPSGQHPPRGAQGAPARSHAWPWAVVAAASALLALLVRHAARRSGS